jgi:hypothetical protein
MALLVAGSTWMVARSTPSLPLGAKSASPNARSASPGPTHCHGGSHCYKRTGTVRCADDESMIPGHRRRDWRPHTCNPCCCWRTGAMRHASCLVIARGPTITRDGTCQGLSTLRVRRERERPPLTHEREGPACA